MRKSLAEKQTSKLVTTQAKLRKGTESAEATPAKHRSVKKIEHSLAHLLNCPNQITDVSICLENQSG